MPSVVSRPPYPLLQPILHVNRCLPGLVGCLVLTVGARPAHAQAGEAAGAARAASAAAPARLQRVIITRHDIYDSADTRGWYSRLMNRVHVRTRQRVVEREMLLHAGDPPDSARAAETGRNLRRLQVFRDVVVDTSADGSTLRVTTRDGWTTRPYASFRSAGTQRLFSVGLLESNFLGLAATLDARYAEDPDRSVMRLAFSAPRLFANRISTGVFFNKLSDGRSVGAAVEQPFFALASRNSARVGFVTLDGRVLRFRDGFARAADSLDRRYSLGYAGVAHALRASPRGYLRIGADAQVRRDDYVRRRDVPLPMQRTITAATTGYVEYSKADFLLTKNYRLLGQPEDVNLSTTVRFGVAVAPGAFGYDRNSVGPVVSGRTAIRLPMGFVQLSGRLNALASGGAIDSGTANVSATIALQPSSRHLLVAFSTLGWQRDPAPGEEFDLGLTRGPRGFQVHAFTGDRLHYSMLEYRWITFPQIGKSFAAGLAAFAETGGAWYDGSPRRSGSDAGLGVRFAPIRSAANVGATRVDLVRRFAHDREPAGWLLVIGTGFSFDALR